MGRWVNADSQLNGATLLGCNLFAYCENNAINYSDPEGRSLIGAILLGVTVFGMIIACSSSNVSPEHVNFSKANRKPGKTPPSSWPPLPDELGGKKPTWNPEGYWEGKEGDLTWDNRSHGSGVDRGNGAQDGHWDDENSNRRWDKEGNPLGSKVPAYTVPIIDYSSEFQIGVAVTATAMFVVGVIYLFYTGDPTVLQQATS